MPLGISISPAQTELIARSGITPTQAYTVENLTDTPLYLSSGVLPWTPQGSDGSVNYENVPDNRYFEFSLMNSDLKLGQSFVLRPRENRQLVLKVKSSSDTPPADTYLTFFVIQDQGSSLRSAASSTAASGRLGSHLLISTSKSEVVDEKLAVAKWQASPRIVDSFFPQIKFGGIVHNSGSHFGKIDGKIVLTKNNRTLEEIALFPHNVLASADRNIMCLSDNNPIPCVLHPPYWPGIYTATVMLQNGSQKSLDFYSFPFTLTIIFGMILGLIMLLRRRPRTR